MEGSGGEKLTDGGIPLIDPSEGQYNAVGAYSLHKQRSEINDYEKRINLLEKAIERN